MNTRLLRDQVAAHVAALTRDSKLTGLQRMRLDGLVRILDDDGRFLLRAALDASEFTGTDTQAQDAFQDFRKKINAAATAAGVELALELDARKEPPDRRHGWFTGGALIDEGIATFTAKAARRIGIAHPVAQSVADLGRATVYVSYAAADAKAAAEVLAALTATLTLDGTRTWHVTDRGAARIGEDREAVLDRLCAEADVRVALVSSRYLTEQSAERHRVLDGPEPVVTVALDGLPDAPLAGPLRLHDILRRRAPWAELTGRAKSVYVSELADALRRAVDPRRTASFTDRSGDDPLTLWSARTATRRRAGESERIVASAEAAETSLAESHLARGERSPGTPAVERLLAWVCDPHGPRLCALLGDVGMGKTTTARLFTRELLRRREADPALPLPILFDLRDVRIADVTASMTTDGILSALLDAGRPASVGPERLTAQVVRRRADQGNAVVVFDGLDEVLVHLSPQDRQHFTRQLWRAVDPESDSRLLVTCRSQYFRTIRDETTYFGTEGRDGLRGDGHLALLMLPFRDEQVRAYLMANLGRDEAWVDRFRETLACVHDLTDLSRRPVTLRMIADQVDVIESAKFAGRAVAAVDLYREFVDRWLARDEEKRVLEREHKHLLMEEIAAGLWRSGRNAWGPAQLDDWLLDVLDRRPDLARRYRHRVPELLTADFRTATFLSRDGDEFSFGHRSLAEYFLACYLCRALVDGRTLDAWAMAVPSEETLDFLGQLVAGLPTEERGVALAALAEVNGHYRRLTSELALAYVLGADRRGHPRQSLVAVQLPGAELEGWRFGTADGPARPLLAMTGANLTGATLRHARFDRVDLSGADLSAADLTVAEFHGSQLVDVRLSRARAVGTILRDCAIDGLEHRDADAYRAAVLRCTPVLALAPRWLIAPSVPQACRSDRLAVLTGHTGGVTAVAWSPDGTRLATAGTDRSVRLWDPTTARPLHTLTGQTDYVTAVAWSPDGTRLATGGTDRSVRLWDPTTARPLHTLTGHTGGVRAVAWSPDGTRLATAGDDGSVRLWDPTTAQPLHTLTGHTGWVTAVAWSPDGTRLATGGTDRSVRLWDPTTAQPLHTLTGHTGGVTAVAWSPDGTRLAIGGTDRSVRLWDPTTAQPVHTLTGHTDYVTAVAWSPDGTRLATGGTDRSVRLWDPTTAQPLHTLTGHTGGVTAVAWSPDGTRLATAGDDRSVRLWDPTTARPLHTLTGHTDYVTAVAWSPDGTRLATAGDDGTVRLWDPATARPLHTLTGHTDYVTAVAWSPDGTRLATAGDDRSVRLWDPATARPVHTLTGHSGGVTAVAWSPDGTRLATAGDDGTVRLWDPTTAQPLHTLTGHTGGVTAVAWSPDGTRLATGGTDRSVRLWDPTTAQPLHTLTGHTGGVTAVAWSPDGTRLATGGTDRSVRLWDPTTARPLHTLTGHTDYVTAVAWSPDGTRLATGGTDRSVRLWDPTTAQPLHTLTGHTGGVRAMAWSPDGTRLATAGDDRSVRLWDPTTGHPAGPRIHLLPDGEVAVFDAATDTLTGASDGAWRWLGWNVIEDGRMTTLPAETYGLLPPMSR